MPGYPLSNQPVSYPFYPPPFQPLPRPPEPPSSQVLELGPQIEPTQVASNVDARSTSNATSTTPQVPPPSSIPDHISAMT
jgi:hypothetical protein